MRVSETLNLNIPDDGLDVDKLERYVAREIRKFGKQVFGKVLQEIEAKKLEEAKGKFGFFLDDVLGLRPYQSATRCVRQRALELAVEYPFRQAKSPLRHEIGDEISHRTIHRWAQEEGKRLREEEEARQEAVFGRAVRKSRTTASSGRLLS